MLDLAFVLALSQSCAPSVAPQTLAAIAHVESRFDPFAIGVNRGLRPTRPRNAAEAAATARRLLSRGGNLDLGLAQINSDNLDWLGLTVEDAFDPCLNLRAAATVLRAGYRPVGETPAHRQTALRVALSRYNTGDAGRGFRNGYVAKVERAAVALQLAAPLSASALAPSDPRLVEPPPPPLPPAAWDVFARGPVRIAFSIVADRSL
ncbi:Type IV secretion system protein virB1 [compost metagenome]